jgi:hypothetical protein
MEIAAFFILVIALIVLAVVGGGVYLIAARLRQKQLDPEADRVEGSADGRRSADGPRDRDRPEHVELGKEQRTRFVGSR